MEGRGGAKAIKNEKDKWSRNEPDRMPHSCEMGEGRRKPGEEKVLAKSTSNGRSFPDSEPDSMPRLATGIGEKKVDKERTNNRRKSKGVKVDEGRTPECRIIEQRSGRRKERVSSGMKGIVEKGAHRVKE